MRIHGLFGKARPHLTECLRLIIKGRTASILFTDPTDLAFSFCPRSNRELEREKVWSRIHLIPLLQAEADRDTYRREVASKEREAEIMKDVKGWKAGESVYNSKRYNPQTFVVVP